MAYTLWSQDVFSKGELSPFMYARATVNEYGYGLKIAQNVLTYPTGAVGKRFGTLYQATLSNINAFDEFYFQTFQYLNECVYQLVFTAGTIYIYLEGVLIATVSNTFNAPQCYNLNSTTLGNTFRVSGFGFKPYDLTRAANTPATITSISPNSFACSGTPFAGANLIYPVKFSVSGGTIMQTTPQIVPGVTYFVLTQNTSTALLFNTAIDAKNQLQIGSFSSPINNIKINGLGTPGATSCIVQNTWTFANTFFKNVPVYDFNGLTTSYDAITFTPAAGTGSTTVTLSSPYAPLNSSYVGGAFISGSGSGRITAVADTSHFTISIQQPFQAGVGILGSLALLAEPAWSDTRGWPQVCSSYQNRALFANTVSLPNGLWASVVNDYADFGDLTTDDDDAISWYPTSDNMNYIKFIVPYRSLTVHTNTGIYSSPLSDISAITPNNFTLQLQDSTPANTLQPQAIDNQVLVISGNDAHRMLWDGINNAYTSDVISVINEQTIRNPVDEIAFYNLNKAGARYVFIINANGSMAVFQTLLSQNVAGFVPQIMEQSYGDASFLQGASSSDGRAWFVCQRQIASSVAPIAISGFTSTTLTATASNFSQTSPTAITFTTTGSLPVSSPQITTTNYFWAIGTGANTFEVYTTQEDALANTNQVTFSSAGTLSNVVAWPLSTIFTLEEFTQDTYIDCAYIYNGSPASTVTVPAIYNAQNLVMVGDGFGFSSPAENNINNQVTFKAHGVTQNVSLAYIGFQINTIIEPMPLIISNGPSGKETTLTKPKHIRSIRFMFTQTIGGTINGIPIALEPFNMANIGQPPTPATGIVEQMIMKGWDDFNFPSYTIEHSDPFNMVLLGVFYSVEI